MSRCKDDVNKPSVDESQVECCGIYPTNCVVTSEADIYLKIRKGDTLTNAIKAISTIIKKAFQRIDSLDRYYEVTATISQSGLNNPTFTGYVGNVPSGATFTRTGIGQYLITYSDPILVPGTVVLMPSISITSNKIISYLVLSTTTIEISTYNFTTSSLEDDLLINDPIYIKIPK